jgi:hypothetical protein
MKRRWIWLVAGLMAMGVGLACVARRDVHLVDGRSFKVAGVHEAKGMISFNANGWEFTLPSGMVTNVKPDRPKGIRRFVVATNSVHTLGHTFRGIDDMFMYLDIFASSTNMVILQLDDPAEWNSEMRDRFAFLLGGFGKRPYVGIEGHWRKP